MSRVKIMSPQKVSIGHDVYLNDDVKIAGQFGVTIGNYVLIGFNASLISVNHSYKQADKPILKQGIEGGLITIGDDVWIGANAVILPKVTVGRGAIVTANSVVSADVPEYSIVGGNPARAFQYRFNAKSIALAKKLDLT